MGRVNIYEYFVEKKFSSLKKFERELKYRNKFENFLIPRILSVNQEDLVIRFEKINFPFLDKELYRFRMGDIENLFSNLPNIEGKTCEIERLKFVNRFIERLPIKMVESIIEEKGFLIHGDFRPQNIFFNGEIFGLIDFENAGYSFKEKDLAYFYMELIYFNNDLSRKFLRKIRDYGSYPRFLFYCLFYTLSSIQNPYSNKKGLESVLKEITFEMNKL